MEIQSYKQDTEQELQQVPQVGDIYVPKECSHSDRILKITGITQSGCYSIETYDFDNSSFVETDRNTITSSDLQNYYRKVLGDYNELVSGVINYQNTNCLENLTNDNSSINIAVAHSSKDKLIEQSQKMEIMASKMAEAQAILKCRIEYQKSKLNQQLSGMHTMIDDYKQKIAKVNQMISMVELYYGIEEEVVTITTGEPAPIDTPISIRQKILFMDEECAVSNVYGHLHDGFDYNNVGDFYEWLKDNDNRDRIIPEERGIAVLKPRRYEKNYGSTYDNAVLNQYNLQSYVIIRNGQQLYSIFTENFAIHGSVFPSKEVTNQLSQGKGNESIIERGQSFAIFVQGIIDRTQLLQPLPAGTSFINCTQNVEFIYDDSNTLTDGSIRYVDWIKNNNQQIEVGSRIVFNQQQFLHDNPDSRYYGEFFKKYYRDYPPIPEDGVYTVSEIIMDGNYERICFKYKPGGTYYSFTDGYKDRTTAVTFMVDRADSYIMNYDAISLADIDYYLNSRIDRPNYIHYVPLLKNIRRKLVEELESEQMFVMLIRNTLHISRADSKRVEDAITWWKYKNKIKRPIQKDDALAFRMITKKLMKDDDNKQ